MVQKQRDARLLRTLLKTKSAARRREIVELLLEDLGQPLQGPTAKKQDYQIVARVEREPAKDDLGGRHVAGAAVRTGIATAIQYVSAAERLARAASTEGTSQEAQAAALLSISLLLGGALDTIDGVITLQEEDLA